MLPHLDPAYNLARWLTHDPDEAVDAVQEATLRALAVLRELSRARRAGRGSCGSSATPC